MPQSEDGIPRRARLDLNTPAELAIRAALEEVEKVGADPLLTEAAILLGQAREKLADYIDRPLKNQCLAAFTELGGYRAYPGYISINAVNGAVEVSVRGQESAEGGEGKTAMVRLTVETFAAVCREALAKVDPAK